MMTPLAFGTQLDTVSDDVDHKLSHDTPTLRSLVTPGDEAIGGDDSPDALVIKVCRSCTRSAPDDADFCPECGGDLVSIRRVPDMYLEEVIGGKYRIVEKVGQGGMGVVYLARNDELGQKVAVKFLSQKFADDENLVLRFLNEAKSYCRVNHPNAVTLLDYGQHGDGGPLFIITEFIEGKNVTETLKDRGPLPADTVLDLGSQIAEVLSAAHSQGVIHRDLKPDNIMLMPLSRGRYAVKVLDFGIAKIVDEEEGPNTETGSVFGTPEFMSPEQARGDEADGRSDIYALGVILFYMITGKLPFRGKNKLVVLNMQLNDPPPRPREVLPTTDLSARFETVIMKCLNKGPNQRYASADDLLEAFEELRVPSGSATSRVGTVRETAATPRLLDSAEGHWEEIHSHGETLASLENSVVEWEVESIEMGRQHDTGRAPPPDRGPGAVSIAVLIVAVLAVAALLWLALADDAPPASPTPNEAVEDDRTEQVDASHRDAVIGIVRRLIEDGKLEDARTTYDYSPVSDSEARKTLNRELTALERVGRDLDAAIAAKDCGKAAGIAASVATKGVRLKFGERVTACQAAVNPVVAPAPAPDKQPVVEQPPVPVVRPNPQPKQDPKPTPELDPEPDPPVVEAETSPKPASESVPDDMTLPPKTLDD